MAVAGWQRYLCFDHKSVLTEPVPAVFNSVAGQASVDPELNIFPMGQRWFEANKEAAGGLSGPNGLTLFGPDSPPATTINSSLIQGRRWQANVSDLNINLDLISVEPQLETISSAEWRAGH